MPDRTVHPLCPRPLPRLMSVVIPLYNEEEGVASLRLEMESFLRKLGCDAELVLVNDGSSDGTIHRLLAWAEEDQRVRVIGLARNFGHQAAVTAGLDLARGDAVVVMDADLQDPPYVVLEMLGEYCKGYDVVYGRRISRDGETAFKRWTAWAFYRVMQAFIHKDLPTDTGDFRLISRRCLDALNSMRETHRFLRGMVAWIGFAQTAVHFVREPRRTGTTKYPLEKMIRLAWTAAVSFSPAPLRISFTLGVIVALCGAGAGIWAITLAILGSSVRGWASIVAINCMLGGSILVSIGILGEYIGRIFEEIKGRPLYVIATLANIPTETAPSEFREESLERQLAEMAWEAGGERAERGYPTADSRLTHDLLHSRY